MRALITGGNGFVGQWLTKSLLASGHDIDLTGLGAAFNGPAVLTPDERRQIRWLPADIRDSDDVERVVERSLPEVVFHLAGVSFPPDADRSPTMAYDVNALGAVRLLAAIRRRKLGGVIDPVVVVVGTGMQYGHHDLADMPLSEGAVQSPMTIYAASKAAQEVAALQFSRGSDIRVICTRSFNHSGVGHGSQYLIPSLVSRVTQIARGDRAGDAARLTLGNDVVRDYLHVADVVDAYRGLAERGVVGEVYNVSSGRGVSARQLAETVLLHAGVTADITTEPSLVRATDISVLVGSPAKLTRDTGWSPRKTHADIIDDLLRSAHAATD